MSKLGIFNPKNFAPDTGGAFKEGLVRVDQSCFKVAQGGGGRANILVLSWSITRLDEETGQPQTDANGDEMTEELHFSFGGSSLSFAHPGQARTPEDDDIDDLGFELNTEGPTIFPIPTPKPFQLNPKSGISKLFVSLRLAGFKEEYLDREWAPDYVGSMFFMKSVLGEGKLKDEKTGQERDWSYKVVDRTLKASYEIKPGDKPGKAAGAAGAKSSAASAAANGKNAEAEEKLQPILEAISTEKAGETMTGNALVLRVSKALQANKKIDVKQHVPIVNLLRDVAWLKKHAGDYDMTVTVDDEGKPSVSFGAGASE